MDASKNTELTLVVTMQEAGLLLESVEGLLADGSLRGNWAWQRKGRGLLKNLHKRLAEMVGVESDYE